MLVSQRRSLDLRGQRARRVSSGSAGLPNYSHTGAVKLLATSEYPSKVICYFYYLLVFSLPFDGAIGGLFLLGVGLVGLALFQPQLFLRDLPKPLWCFASYLFIVAILGLSTMLDAPRQVDLPARIIKTLFKVSQLLVFFLIAYRMMTFDKIAKVSLFSLAVSCILLAVLQEAGVTSTEEGRVAHERMSAFGGNPNVLAGILSMGLLSLVGLAYGRKDITGKIRLLAWLGSGLLLIAIVRTGSRGALIALMLALIALTVKPSLIAERLKTILIALLVIAVLGVASYQLEAVRNRWEITYYEGDVAGRQVLLPVAWEMFLEKPMIGWGPVVQSDEMGFRTLSPTGGDPHNIYLWLLLETGMLGTVPFLIGLGLCWRSVWRARGGVHGSVPLALLSFLLVVNLKATYLYFTMFWFVLAYASASGSRASASWRIAFPAPSVKRRVYMRGRH
jgi:O-antigen ligase